MQSICYAKHMLGLSNAYFLNTKHMLCKAYAVVFIVDNLVGAKLDIHEICQANGIAFCFKLDDLYAHEDV